MLFEVSNRKFLPNSFGLSLQAGASTAATNFARWSAFLTWAGDGSEPRVALLARVSLPELAYFAGILVSGALPKAADGGAVLPDVLLPPQSSLTSRAALQVCVFAWCSIPESSLRLLVNATRIAVVLGDCAWARACE